MHTVFAPNPRACRKSVSRAITWHLLARPLGYNSVQISPTVLRYAPIVHCRALIPRDPSGLRFPFLLALAQEVDMMGQVVTSLSSHLQFQDFGATVLSMVVHTIPCRQQSEPSIVE